MELSNGNQFELIDGELFHSSSGAYNYLLNDSSLEEQNQQIEENQIVGVTVKANIMKKPSYYYLFHLSFSETISTED